MQKSYHMEKNILNRGQHQLESLKMENREREDTKQFWLFPYLPKNIFQ